MKILKKLFQRDSIRNQFRIWVVLLTFIISFFIFVPSLFMEYHQTIKHQDEEMTYFLNAQTYFFESWLSERSKDINTIAKLDTVKEHNYEESRGFFQDFMNGTDFTDLIVINKEGIVQFDTSTENSKDSVGMDVIDREYFRVAKVGKQQYITDVQISKVTNKPIMSIASPILDEEQNFNGVVLGTINLDVIDQLLHESRVGQLGHAYLVNQDGILLTNFNFNQQIDKNNEIVDIFSENYIIDENILALARKQSGQSLDMYKDVRDEWVLGESQAVNGGKWYIISEVGVLEAYAPFIKRFALLAFCILLGSIATIRLTLYLARKIEEPIQYLLEGVRFVEQGKYDHQIDEKHTTPFVKEFRELCAAFNRMSDKVKGNTILLEGLSTTCQLTNIYNRRYLMEQGERVFRECVASGSHVSCVAIDIDFFKKVNDTYGHTIGDEVLKHVAKVISYSVRENDIVTRYGGEEFVILSPNTSLEMSAILAEKIRYEIEKTPCVIETTKIYLTASIGISEYFAYEDVSTIASLIDRADKALYVAKGSGRNQVQLYEGVEVASSS
ncbi:diguanylate cyclase [Lysinibacillus sp. NPDC097287]|uniref:sensor domain-containing diguanylate cyclase n=1 Tax=Lysinibacillus sp. NPDC097287 TaxID=3364144 RepID=UPI0037FED472